MLRFAGVLILAAASLSLGAQQRGCCGDTSDQAELVPPAATGKAVELTGTVSQIHILAGQGMPYLELKKGADVTRVYLGPMPFLVAENFNPKSGQELAVKGYKLQDWILAAEITFVAEKRTVKFRDDRGWPVWRGGFGRGARR